jgi:hypothetical protein
MEHMCIKEIPNIINEQLYQNEFSTNSKITTYFYGPPGVGKTEIVKNFPLYRLQLINNEKLKKLGINNPIVYNTYDSIEKQHVDLNLTRFGLYTKIDTAVVYVSQSDIIVPEDISGLPSSISDIEILIEKIKLAELCKKFNAESKYLDSLLNIANNVLEFSINNEDEKLLKTLDRNTTKFDYTEWEQKLHTLATNSDIKYIVLLLDDITRSANNNTTILNVLMPLFQLNLVGQRPLPKNCSIVVTSNEVSGDDEFFYVPELDPAQNDRLFKIKVDFDFDTWKEYAVTNKLHHQAIGFAEKHKSIFNKVTPRRWTQFAKMLYTTYGNTPIDDVKNISTLLKLNFGDSDNQNYQNLIESFKIYLNPEGDEVGKIISEIIKSGYTDEIYAYITNLVKTNQTLKLRTLCYSLINLVTTELVNHNVKTAFKEIFLSSELLPVQFILQLKSLKLELVNMRTNKNTNPLVIKQAEELFSEIFHKIRFIENVNTV